MDALKVADRLAALAAADRRHRPDLNDGDAIELGAVAIRTAVDEFRKAHQRAARLAQEVAALRVRLAEVQAENVQLRADNRALAAVAGRPETVPTEQVVTVDSRGNLQRIVTKPIRDEARPAIGFA
jgi:regulator of replication initiation timing